MPRKQPGYERRGPESSGHRLEQKKKQNRVCSVQDKVREKKTARVHSIELAVQHERNPGKRMPIAKISGLKCPADTSPGQARRNMRAVKKIMLIIEADELVRRDGPIAESGDCGEEETNPSRKR